MSNFPIFFVYLYYPMKMERKFLKGPPLAPPCFEKSGPPPDEKKIGPPPLGFWSLPTYGLLYIFMAWTDERKKELYDQKRYFKF